MLVFIANIGLVLMCGLVGQLVMALNLARLDLNAWDGISSAAFIPDELDYPEERGQIVQNFVQRERDVIEASSNILTHPSYISDNNIEVIINEAKEENCIGTIRKQFPLDQMKDYVPEKAAQGWNLLDPDIVDSILSYWGDKCGYLPIMESKNETELDSFVPDDLAVTACNYVTKHLESLHKSDARIVARLCKEYYLTNNYLVSKTGARAALAVKDWVNKFYEEEAANNSMEEEEVIGWKRFETQANNLIENMFEARIEVSEYNNTKLTARKLKSFGPVASYNSKWFPTGSEYWANLWRLYFYNKVSAAAVRSEIKHWAGPDGCMNKDGSRWHPTSAYHLHMMHQILVCNYNVYILKGYVNRWDSGKRGGMVYKEEREWAYDKIGNDIRMYYNSPFHRTALLASLETHKVFKLGNPIHRNQRNSKCIHSVQLELSRHALFWWLQKVVFIVNKKQITNHNYWTETIKITVGTFITHLSESKFGLVTDVISEKWSIEFDRDDMNFEEFSLYLQQNLDQIEKSHGSDERVRNQLIHPIWELDLLPLEWKFDNCWNGKHNHFTDSDQELFLNIDVNCNSSKQIAENIICRIQVTDEFRIGNLQINDGLARFEDPNSHLEGYQNYFEYDWKFNFVIINYEENGIPKKRVQHTLLHDGLYDFLLNLNDPYFRIWPGCVRHPSKAPNGMTVCAYTFNADGYHVSTCENNVRPNESIKQHYISLNDYLLRNNMVTSLGVVMEDHQNNPFYTVMEGDVIRCMFKGVECDNNLKVFCIPIANCSDGKEIKINTGIIGPLNDRNDYSSTFSKYESIATLKALHERHYAHSLSQRHLNKMRVSAHTFVPYYIGINWHRIHCNLTYLDLSHDFVQKFRNKITSSIDLLKRKAGIALTGVPSLSFLPSLNLAVPEIMHNTMDGILGGLAKKALESVPGLHQNAAISKIYNETFQKLSRSSKFRTSTLPATNLFKGSSKGLQTSKAINTYISAFTLGLVGDVIGVDPFILETLQKMLTWLGLFHSPTLNGNNIDKLVALCDEICERIESNPFLALHFWQKGQIRVWRNLNQKKLYWIASADRFIGMIFERLNKLSRLRGEKWKQQQKYIVLTNHNIMERTIKDLETTILDRIGNLGWGFIELFASDDDYCWLLHKLLKYSLENDEFELNRNSDVRNCSFESKFIRLMAVKDIKSQIFEDICDELKEQEDSGASEAQVSETTSMERLKVMLFWNNMDSILEFLFQWDSVAESDGIRNEFITGLQNEEITVQHSKGFSLFYREWSDCEIRSKKTNQDIVWIRPLEDDDNHSFDFCAELQGIFIIHGLCQNPLLREHINPYSSATPDHFVLCIGSKWTPILIGTSLNYELYDFQHTPSIRPTDEICVFDAANIVMKMYCAHRHITPSKQDLKFVKNAIENFPKLEETFWPDNNDTIVHPPELRKYWCGFAIKCLCPKQRVNCDECDSNPGQIVISCIEELWPVYRLYGIYQGSILRYLTTQTVSE